MFGVLMALELVICIFLIVAILMQASKGGGLAGTFGGGQVGMMFGVRRTADFLTKGTQILAGAFMILALIINVFFLPRTTGNVESVLQRGSATTAPAPSVPQLPPTEAPTQQSPVTTPPQGK